MPSFAECVDNRERTRHKLETRWTRDVWSSGVFVGVRVRTTERIVMDETGDYVVQSVRRVPKEQRYGEKLLQSVRGNPWELNAAMELPEPMLITPQLTDVETAPKRICSCDHSGIRNVYIRKADLQKFGHTSRCPAYEVHRAGLPISGLGHTAECSMRLADAMTTDASTAARGTAARLRQAERFLKDLDRSGEDNPAVQVTKEKLKMGTPANVSRWKTERKTKN